MSDYISKSAVIELIESKMTDGCLGTEDDTFIGGHGLVDGISDLPTVDEKEIIHKLVEQIIKRFEEEIKQSPEASLREYRAGLYKGIEMVSEEGGIK